MKRHQIAVLGGAGFVGRYVVKRLAGRGEVLTVGGRHATDAGFLKLKGDVGQVGLVNIAIGADEAMLRAFVAGKDALINCVGILYERGAQKFEIVHHSAPAKLARLAVMSPFVPLIGGGETRFQPVYVGDVASSVVRVLDDPATAGRTYELGGPKIYTFRGLMELVLAEIRRHRHFVDV